MPILQDFKDFTFGTRWYYVVLNLNGTNGIQRGKVFNTIL